MKQEKDSTKSQRLTLDEMYNILELNAYEKYHSLITKTSDGKRYVNKTMIWNHPEFRQLLYRHIIAEQLLKEDYKNIDWDEYDVFDPSTYLHLVELWMKPLVWKNALDYSDIIIDGRIATEEYDSQRMDEINEVLNIINVKTLLHFADQPYTIDEDETEMGYVKGMHEWGNLTCDYTSLFMTIINGGHVEYEDIRNAKYYDAGTLRCNLTCIAEHRGGKRAVEILEMLQAEWPKIKLWKTYFNTMTNDDIQQFEEVLLHGFDDLIEEWSGEPRTDNPINLPPKKDYKKLVDWLEYEKKEGRDYYAYANNNRSLMCRNLSKIVGWIVNENSLQKAQNRLHD